MPEDATPDLAQSQYWLRLEVLFHEASRMSDSDRPAFLLEACGESVQLRNELEALLRASGKTFALLEKPVQDVANEFVFQDDSSGKRVGVYRTIRLLGEGGMGKVYLAARADDAYEARVAVKVIGGFLEQNAPMLSRFRAERQILANLNHPSIARLLDGGVTAEGKPYFVMEYIDGISVDKYCRENKLTVHDRLLIFCKICNAVEYAHRNLIVHRDIKPANILVDAQGEPKLLDFGIAKLLDAGSPLVGGAQTSTTEWLMTPDYASPEQVRGEPISTSTDVYGLGVLLYELLSERRPFQSKTSSPLSLIRDVCEKNPDPPSVALRHASTPALPDPGTVGRDLDNIVLTAVRKEPSRRYSSAAQLSADIQAFVDGYPVSASNPSWSYRAGKFINRHRVGVLGTMLATLALVGFSVGMGIFAARANRAQVKAQMEADFLSSMFQAASPDMARGHEITARDLLDRGARRINRELTAEPNVRASLLASIGQAYSDLGLYSQGLSLLEKSFGPHGPQSSIDGGSRATILNLMGTLHRLQGQYKAAEPFFRRTLAVQRATLHSSNPQIASSLADLGECLYLEEKDSEAEPFLREALQIYRENPPDGGDGARNYLALLLERKGSFAEAAHLLSEAVQITRAREGADSPNYATSLHNWASALIDAGDLKGAESKLREVLAIRRKVLGNHHPELAYTLNNLGYVLLEWGDWQDAEPFLRESLSIRSTALGADNPVLAPSWNNVARVLQARGTYQEAQRTYQHALELAGKGNNAWFAAQIEGNMGVLAFDEGNYTEAERLGAASLRAEEKTQGTQTPAVASSLIALGMDRLYQGDANGAESLYRQALTIREGKYPANHLMVINAEGRLGEALLVQGRNNDAEAILRKAAGSISTSRVPLPPWQIAEVRSTLAICQAALRGEQLSKEHMGSDTVMLAGDPRPIFREDPRVRIANLVRVWKERHHNEAVRMTPAPLKQDISRSANVAGSSRPAP